MIEALVGGDWERYIAGVQAAIALPYLTACICGDPHPQRIRTVRPSCWRSLACPYTTATDDLREPITYDAHMSTVQVGSPTVIARRTLETKTQGVSVRATRIP